MANPKTLDKKRGAVQELTDMFKHSELAVLTDYRGLTVGEISQLRRQLREAGVDYRVTKNTLARFAAENAGLPGLTKMLVGPTAIAFGKDDASRVARMLREYARTSKVFKLKGGALQGKIAAPEDVSILADLPPRDVLFGQVLAGIQSPLAGLVGVLNAPLQNLMYALQARADQLQAAS